MKTQQEKDKHAEYVKEYYRNNPEVRERAHRTRQERLKDPQARKRHNAYGRKYRTGVSTEQFEKAWEEQKGLCAICATPLKLGVGGHATDHCHATKKFRGLLCMLCNTGLGKFKDSPELLAKAIDYLG